MSGLVKLLLAVVLLVVLVFAGNTVVFEFKRSGVDAASKAFVDHAIPAIATQWNGAELLRQGTPRLRASLDRGDLAALSAGFAKLGPCWQYLGSTGAVHMPSVPFFGGPMSASYVARETYQEGLATIEIELVQIKGRWWIDKFHVDVQWFGPTPPIYG